MARYGAQRTEFERNRKKIISREDVCAICGKPVDKKLPYPHPMSATVDHIIPLAKGGHPSDINNMQLAHLICNRLKSDKIIDAKVAKKGEEISNRNLPQHVDWKHFSSL